MRNKIVLALMLLTLTAWAVAQETTQPSAPATGSQTMPQEPGQRPATPATPDTPSATQPPAVDDTNVIEGCLGGTAPNFTVTDKAGTTYKLDIPPGADASVLTKHVGESVQVMGNVNGASATGESGTTKTSSSIAVQRIGRGKGACPAGSEKPQSDKPLDKPQSDKPVDKDKPEGEKPMSEKPPVAVKPPTK